MKYLAFLTLVGTALTAAWRADAQTTQMGSPMPAAGAPAAGASVAVTLATAGQAGGPTAQAVLTQQGKDVLVTVTMPNAGTASSNVSIYRGACSAAPSGKAVRVLGKLSNGTLRATVPKTTVAQLAQSPNTIVIEQTPSLCGDLSAANPVPAGGASAGPPGAPGQPGPQATQKPH